MTRGISLYIFALFGHLSEESFFFFSFIFISWRLITLQYCSGFCHTLTKNTTIKKKKKGKDPDTGKD